MLYACNSSLAKHSNRRLIVVLPGVELCLAGAAKDVELDLGALGIDLRKMDEKSGKALLHDALMKELHLSAKGKRVLPLKTGEWA